MHISLGLNLQTGPWGGGNQFGQSLYAFLQKKKVDVSFDLKDNNLDVILLVEPRRTLKISAYNHVDILRYRLYKNKKALTVHRINECDERKGTNDVNKMIVNANAISDFTVFISRWLKELYFNLGLNQTSSRIIMNGANKEIFNNHSYRRWNGKEKLKLVTHHWGAGFLKGFDIYQELDQLLSSAQYNNRFIFTYIGNIPKGMNFSHSNLVQPLSGVELASALQSNHVYLTASQNEPAGMHHIEGALCGLPVLYRLSGAIPEYCNGFGISFSPETFESKLNEMYDTYQSWVEKMPEYPFDAENMCQQYYDLFIELLDRREEIINQRKNQGSMALYFDSLLPYNLIHKIRGKFKQWIT